MAQRFVMVCQRFVQTFESNVSQTFLLHLKMTLQGLEDLRNLWRFSHTSLGGLAKRFNIRMILRLNKVWPKVWFKRRSNVGNTYEYYISRFGKLFTFYVIGGGLAKLTWEVRQYVPTTSAQRVCPGGVNFIGVNPEI